MITLELFLEAEGAIAHRAHGDTDDQVIALLSHAKYYGVRFVGGHEGFDELTVQSQSWSVEPRVCCYPASEGTNRK